MTRFLMLPPLPSVSIYGSIISTVPGFGYRELSPYKIKPTQGVHLLLHKDSKGLPPTLPVSSALGRRLRRKKRYILIVLL